MYCDVHESAQARKWLDSRLLLGTAAIALLASPVAFANPKDGTVTSGVASISSPSSKITNVNQASEGVVIDWSSFNIGNGQTTQFVQPNASAIAINRIGSASASSILGTLDANGRVVLINANGLAFGRNSQVNVGSLIATTTGGSDSDLVAGKFTTAGSQNASIINRGTITAAGGSTVALVAPNVTNRCTVQAKLGTVSLGAANAFTVDFAGDGLVSFAAQGDVNGKAQVTNAGTLSGANVSMTARAAEGVATGVVNVRGTIQALGAHNVGGTIVLDAGDDGSIDVSHASLDASGAKGGGSVTIGGWNQSSVDIDKHTVVDASATKAGNGGTIDVTAAVDRFRGQALAAGGSQTGNGGHVDTSGDVLDVKGAWISTAAPHGATGLWSIDPENVTISTASDLTDSCSAGVCTPTGDNSVLNVGELESALVATDVAVTTGATGTQAGDITVASTLTWASTHTLTLDAAGAINIDAPLTLTGAGGLDLDAATSGLGFTELYFSGGYVNYADITEQYTVHGSLTINGNVYTLENSILYLASDIRANPGGYFALGDSYNASNAPGGEPYTSAPIPTTLTGTFEGLGNTISNVTIDDNADTNIGLFAELSGTIRDLGLTGVSVTSTKNNAYFGGLVGYDDGGSVANAYVTGTVTESGLGSLTGGLVGNQVGGAVTNSYATDVVTGGFSGYVGGLVGETTSSAEISESFAAGAVTGGTGAKVGGLVGINLGIIYLTPSPVWGRF